MRWLAVTIVLCSTDAAQASGAIPEEWSTLLDLADSLPEPVQRWIGDETPQTLNALIWNYMFDELWGVEPDSDREKEKLAVLYLNVLYYTDCLVGECQFPDREAGFTSNGWQFSSAEDILGIECLEIREISEQEYCFTDPDGEPAYFPCHTPIEYKEFYDRPFRVFQDPRYSNAVHYQGEAYSLPRWTYQETYQYTDWEYRDGGRYYVTTVYRYTCQDPVGNDFSFTDMTADEKLAYITDVLESRYESRKDTIDRWADSVPTECEPTTYSCLTENTREWPRL